MDDDGDEETPRDCGPTPGIKKRVSAGDVAGSGTGMGRGTRKGRSGRAVGRGPGKRRGTRKARESGAGGTDCVERMNHHDDGWVRGVPFRWRRGLGGGSWG